MFYKMIESQLAKNNLLNAPKEKKTNKSLGGFANVKANVSNRKKKSHKYIK